MPRTKRKPRSNGSPTVEMTDLVKEEEEFLRPNETKASASLTTTPTKESSKEEPMVSTYSKDVSPPKSEPLDGSSTPAKRRRKKPVSPQEKERQRVVMAEKIRCLVALEKAKVCGLLADDGVGGNASTSELASEDAASSASPSTSMKQRKTCPLVSFAHIALTIGTQIANDVKSRLTPENANPEDEEDSKNNNNNSTLIDDIGPDDGENQDDDLETSAKLSKTFADGRSRKRNLIGLLRKLDNPPNKHICDICQREYATSSNLSRHKQTHCEMEDAKPCLDCGKRYVSGPALTMHMLTHQKKFRCQQCGKQFSRPWLLQGHVRSHTGEKPFQCSHCGKKFADRSNLRAHTQTHTPNKSFVCPFCSRHFALKAYLTKHLENCALQTTSGGSVAVSSNATTVGLHFRPHTAPVTASILTSGTLSPVVSSAMPAPSAANGIARAHNKQHAVTYALGCLRAETGPQQLVNGGQMPRSPSVASNASQQSNTILQNLINKPGCHSGVHPNQDSQDAANAASSNATYTNPISNNNISPPITSTPTTYTILRKAVAPRTPNKSPVQPISAAPISANLQSPPLKPTSLLAVPTVQRINATGTATLQLIAMRRGTSMGSTAGSLTPITPMTAVESSLATPFSSVNNTPVQASPQLLPNGFTLHHHHLSGSNGSTKKSANVLVQPIQRS